MFGRAQRQSARSRAGARATKLHSIASMMRGRTFTGRFDTGGVSCSFTYTPARAALTGGKLQLTGDLVVIAGSHTVSPRAVRDVRATLIATQGGIGSAPARQNVPADIPPPRPDFPIVESTGSLSFCGVLYFKLAPLDGRALGVPADMRQVQLNVRLAPVSDAERGLQAAFSSIADAVYGQQVDRSSAEAAIRELNKLLAG